MAEAVAIAVLAVVLAAATLRLPRLPEAPTALGGGLLLLVLGGITPRHARDALGDLAPTAALLVTLLVLARGCDRAGLFAAAGDRLGAGAGPEPDRLLARVLVLAALTTITLSLDATAVLVTPVVLGAVRRLERPAAPHLHLTAHLANSASLLLPIANLTNVLAFRRTGLSFGRFAALMALPWLVVIGVEWVGTRRQFAEELSVAPPPEASPPEPRPWPVRALVVVFATLAGFVLAGLAGLDPAWVGLAGALAITASGGRAVARAAVRRADLEFVCYALGLAVVVRAVGDHGLSRLMGELVPSGTGLLALLDVCALGAVAANLLNNLPATLLLLGPVAAAGGAGAVLALLIGVNVGPNLTWPGSLATLLWRRALAAAGEPTSVRTWTRLGLRTVPAGLLLGTVALWLALRTIGA